MNQASPIFVGVPVYRGWDFLDETLRSIRQQTFENYRVLMSIDANDQRSAEVCAKYTDDARFQLAVQAEHLGWAANLNWLMARSEGDFFCYWQQDDFCTNSYLQVLYDYAVHHPEAVCAYTDLQCFGSRMDRIESKSLKGFALTRVLEQVELFHFVPIRGLIRRSALAAAGPLRKSQFNDCLEDLAWLANLARVGELHRVTGALYFKREHKTNLHVDWFGWPQERRRGAWIELGLGLLEAALPLLQPNEYSRMIRTVLDRLTFPRPGRWLFYNPSAGGATELICFAAEFVSKARQRCGLNTWSEILSLSDEHTTVACLEKRSNRMRESLVFTPESHFTEVKFQDDGTERLLLDVALRDAWFEQLRTRLSQEGRIEARFAAGESGTALLEPGWSTPESNSVWSNGPTSRLRLPLPDQDKRWRLALQGFGYAAGLSGSAQRSVSLRMGHDTVVRLIFTQHAHRFDAELILPAREAAADNVIELTFPDAVAPAEIGCGQDPRRLGIALEKIVLSRL